MKNSRVYIDAEENENNIRFIFKNIAAYEMNFNSNDIMERFIRGDASRSTGGSGLGLVVAKSLVELQNGNLGIVVGYSQVLVGKIYIYFSTYKLTVKIFVISRIYSTFYLT